MNNQDERFWSEFSEEELQDPASKHVLAALRDSYRIDEADRQSVRHAWKRVAANMDQEQSISHKLTVPLPLAGMGNLLPPRRSSMRRRIDMLVAVCIIFLLVGSMIGVIAHFQAHNSALGGLSASTATVQPTTTPVIVQHLGTSLGEFSLGVNVNNTTINNLCPSPYSFPDQNLLQLQCGKDNLLIELDGSRYQVSSKIMQLIGWGSFQGTTAEGLRLGMSFERFQALYRQFLPGVKSITDLQTISFSFPIYLPKQSFGFATAMTDGSTTLWVLFNLKQQVAQIVLRSDALFQAVPTAVG